MSWLCEEALDIFGLLFYEDFLLMEGYRDVVNKIVYESKFFDDVLMQIITTRHGF
jgi:hypothetical protein